MSIQIADWEAYCADMALESQAEAAVQRVHLPSLEDVNYVNCNILEGNVPMFRATALDGFTYSFQVRLVALSLTQGLQFFCRIVDEEGERLSSDFLKECPPRGWEAILRYVEGVSPEPSPAEWASMSPREQETAREILRDIRKSA